MRFLSLHRLASITALATYLVVNVGAGALHHHHGALVVSGEWATALDACLQIQKTSADDDDDDEDGCLLCSVLHLAQALPPTFSIAGITALTGRAFTAAAVIRPYPLETPPHSRGPPMA